MQLVVDDSAVDLAVVRGFIADDNALEALSHEGGRPDYAALYAAAPVLREADSFVADQWALVGYAGMQVTRGVMLDQVRRTGILPHLDELRYGDRIVEAVVQGSLALQGERLFSGERVPANFKTVDGRLDKAAFEACWGHGTPLNEKVWNGYRPRTEITVRAGDLALFAHHPYATLHAVRHTDEQHSVARLLNWYAEQSNQ